MLLVAVLAAAPARADMTALSPTTVDSPGSTGGPITPPPNPVDTTGGANSQSTPTAPQDNTVTNTQTTSTTGGNGGRATGGKAGPSRGAGGSAFANGGSAESHSNLANEQSSRSPGRHGSSGDGNDNWGGHDGFVVESPKRRHPARAVTGTRRARSESSVRSDAPTSRAMRLELNAPRGHETAKVSRLGGGLPRHDSPLPGQNPFFTLFSGSGGPGTGLMLLLLAVLASSIALPRQLSKAFRTRTPAWRPLAYVPPIDLPG